MKYFGILALLLVSLGALLFSVYKGKMADDWDSLNQKFIDSYDAGEYDRAMELARKALHVAEKDFGPDHPHVATSLNNLAVLYNGQGNDAKA